VDQREKIEPSLKKTLAGREWGLRRIYFFSDEGRHNLLKGEGEEEVNRGRNEGVNCEKKKKRNTPPSTGERSPLIKGSW